MEKYIAPEESRAGAIVETAIDTVPGVVVRTVDFMTLCPDNMPEKYKRLCNHLGFYSAREFQATNDADEDADRFVKGMEWGYALARCSALTDPKLSFSRFGAKGDIEDRMDLLRANIRDYVRGSQELAWVVRELVEYAEPDDRYSNIVGWGIVSALYMVDQGERNKEAKARRDEELRQFQTDQKDFDMKFVSIKDEEELAQREQDTASWYELVDQLQDEGLWTNMY
jgi:hypothetical protein